MEAKNEVLEDDFSFQRADVRKVRTTHQLAAGHLLQILHIHGRILDDSLDSYLDGLDLGGHSWQTSETPFLLVVLPGYGDSNVPKRNSKIKEMVNNTNLIRIIIVATLSISVVIVVG